MRQWKRYGWVGLALVAAGCGSGSDKTPGVKNTPVQTAAKLESFEGCAALEQFIEDSATTQMRASLESFKNPSSGGFGWGPRGGVADGAPPPMGAPVPAEDAAGGGSSGPDNSTGTNNQVEGVHEADFVQNDGTRIFVLSGPKLYIHRSWPAEQLVRTAALEVEGWPREMLLDAERNRLVITSEVYEQRPGRPNLTDGRSGDGVSAPAMDCAGLGCGYFYGNTLKVTVVDVADLAAPKVVEQVYVPGGYVNARRVEGSVRLVVSDQFRWPEDIRFYPEYSEDLYKDKEKLDKAVDALIARNEKLIRAQTLDQWLAPGRRVDAQGHVTPLTYACTDFYHANAPTGLGFVTVMSLSTDASAAGAAPGRTSVVTMPGEVYASKDALYLATPHWWWWPEIGQSDSTYLHKFDIREAGKTTYVGSGTVAGSVANQFSMDEHEGVLRVATTVSTRTVDVQNPQWWRFDTASRITTFREQDGKLEELGRSEDLAKGERIFSARFVGKKGYVVTFLQKDPLFTFDLSDPAHPRQVGELKVLGFSTYIHPIGDTHLLALGEDRDETGGWNSRALKLTLFDVTDLEHPKEAFTQVVGTASSYSEALYEHKAFNYFPAKGLLAIPFTDWSYDSYDYWSGFRSELRVFRVDTTAGITPVGALSMKDVYQTFNQRGWNWYWSPMVRRSVMADDYVYAITDAGLRVSKVDALQTPLATSRFDAPVMP
ncbi:beta-propeller domain-containing protein [Pyxidicoccus parkwayensis]|uniref:Beta-propeller domain-containing protein n=1 Tax=Pyxidicoccus parkwayensis TaxID=2813578 RepID=A0ABX7NTL1_9BACT|nr:beta-propeller domain-containing protein [Pyxidicoccus parkwaysis]QSQ22130.1 beta-propeller domain-containing protein [Pyxidicoccus parkwaysis]